jgi:tRNA threonylcarbamoyladenosine biosynthesis protein TsaE
MSHPRCELNEAMIRMKVKAFAKLWSLLILILAQLWLMPVAKAHPHIWIDGTVELVFNVQGQAAVVRQSWLFDELFSTYALQGMPRDKTGQVPAKELEKITQEWMTALGEPESHFFTKITLGGKALANGAPQNAKTTWDPKAGQLVLSFDLPIEPATTVGASGMEIDIQDPSYFVAFNYKGLKSFKGVDLPSRCKLSYMPPRPLDPKTERLLWSVPPDQKELPPNLKEAVRQLSHQFTVKCP